MFTQRAGLSRKKIQERQPGRPVDQSQFSRSRAFTSAAGAHASERRGCASSCWKCASAVPRVPSIEIHARPALQIPPERGDSLARVQSLKTRGDADGESQRKLLECPGNHERTERGLRSSEQSASARFGSKELEGLLAKRATRKSENPKERRDGERSDANVHDARSAVGGQLSVSLENRKDDASQPASRWRRRRGEGGLLPSAACDRP